MTQTYGFLPSVERVLALDSARHIDLADSLTYVVHQSAEVAPAIADVVTPVIARIRAGDRLAPAAFGCYFELVERLVADDLAQAGAAAHKLASVPLRSENPVVHGRGTPASAGLDEVLEWRMGEGAARFAPVNDDVVAEFSDRFHAGLDLLRKGYPDVHDEICVLAREVCLAQSPAGATTTFDGASHYQFWGLLFLNPSFHQDRVAMAEVLAHETAHSLLFGMTVDEPLVFNPDDQLFPSPLRRDPRPMDGIFHATFVSARMALVMERLAQSGVLTPSEVERSLEAARSDRANFASGHSVLVADAKFSKTGAAIMEGAADWIAQSVP